MSALTVDDRNAKTSAEEVARFKREKPQRYFAYHDAKPSGFEPVRRLHHGDDITTWTGERLGGVVWAGEPFRDNFGGIRQNFNARCINGLDYAGTAYLSAGTYVRLRALKGLI